MAENKKPSPQRLEAFLDQVILRIFNSSPGLSSYIESFRAVPERGVVEISFYKSGVPEEIVSAVLAAFSIQDMEVLRYVKEKQPCVGFRAKPTVQELSALAVDDDDSKAATDPIEPDGTDDGLVDAEKLANDSLSVPQQSDQVF